MVCRPVGDVPVDEVHVRGARRAVLEEDPEEVLELAVRVAEDDDAVGDLDLAHAASSREESAGLCEELREEPGPFMWTSHDSTEGGSLFSKPAGLRKNTFFGPKMHV